MDEIFGGIVDKAFSIAVSAFLLLRMERELKLLRESIDRLRHCAICKLSPINEALNMANCEENRKLWKTYGTEESNP